MNNVELLIIDKIRYHTTSPCQWNEETRRVLIYPNKLGSRITVDIFILIFGGDYFSCTCYGRSDGSVKNSSLRSCKVVMWTFCKEKTQWKFESIIFIVKYEIILFLPISVTFRFTYFNWYRINNYYEYFLSRYE